MIGTHDIRAQAGIAISAESIGPRMYAKVDGIPVMHPVWAVSFEMRYAASDRAAARVLDLATYSDLVSIEEQTALLTPHQNGRTGIPQARRGLLLADENSWSPRESDMRMIWEIDAGVGRPLTNRPLFDLDGRHIATPDLVDPSTGVVGEYDSDLYHHDRNDRDIAREALYRRYDLEVVIMVSRDIRDPAAFLRRLHEAYVRTGRRPVAPRTWTLDPPPWWQPTVTVEQRRGLSAAQRARFLAHRVS